MERDGAEAVMVPAPLIGRVAAATIDFVGILLVCFALTALVEEPVFYFYGVITRPALPPCIQNLTSVILWAIWLVVPLLYFTFAEGSSGSTLGKYCLGIKVVDEKTLGTIGYGRALFRNLLKVASVYVCGIGLLIFIFLLSSEKKQSIHDGIVRSIVVSV